METTNGFNDKERILYQLIHKDNWSVVHERDLIDGIYVKLPKRLSLIIDLKSSGVSNKEISEYLQIKESSVKRQLRRAKKLIFHILYK